MTSLNGLCLTCAYSGRCAFRKNARSGTNFCEEYKTHDRPAPVLPSALVSPVPVKNRPSRVKGLCGNCSQYGNCGFPKPEAGVWHCEEYR